jgi:3-phenylpropionate/trans-cinnamate dioxygenase ferredoxin subunit
MPGEGFLPACSVDDLDDGEAVHVDLEGRPVAVVRTEGRFFAIHDVCSHAEVPLSEGDIEGCTLECWLHGSRFDLRTGEPTGLPATVPVPVYPTEVADGTVYVSLVPAYSSANSSADGES